MQNLIVFGLIILLIALDFFSGIIGAIITKQYNSSAMREGLLHKSVYLAVIALALICEYVSGYYDLGLPVGLLTLVATWVILTEISSILENLSIINPKLKDAKLLSFFKSNHEVGD